VASRKRRVGEGLIKWFRVLYRRYATKGFRNYGWRFPSDSLIRANETVDQTCRVRDKYRWTYFVEEIDPRDIDYPKDDDSSAG
jgi:hypothetical protein